MSQQFILHPNLEILKQYSDWDIKIPLDCPVTIEVPGIKSLDQKQKIEQEFRITLQDQKLECHYDNLLVIRLTLFNWAYNFQETAYESFAYEHKVKEAANLFRYFKKIEKKHKKSIVKFIPKSIDVKFENYKNIEIKHPELIFSMIEPLLTLYNGLDNVSFIPHYGKKGFKIINKENIESLSEYSPQNPYRLKGKVIAVFLIHMLDYIEDQTTYKRRPGKKTSSKQLRIVYPLLEVLGVIEEKDRKSSQVETLKSIIKNYIKPPNSKEL